MDWIVTKSLIPNFRELNHGKSQSSPNFALTIFADYIPMLTEIPSVCWFDGGPTMFAAKIHIFDCRASTMFTCETTMIWLVKSQVFLVKTCENKILPVETIPIFSDSMNGSSGFEAFWEAVRLACSIQQWASGPSGLPQKSLDHWIRMGYQWDWNGIVGLEWYITGISMGYPRYINHWMSPHGGRYKYHGDGMGKWWFLWVEKIPGLIGVNWFAIFHC